MEKWTLFELIFEEVQSFLWSILFREDFDLLIFAITFPEIESHMNNKFDLPDNSLALKMTSF